jgi:hypothetical protein
VQRARLGRAHSARVPALRLHRVLHVRAPRLAQAGEVDALGARLARQAERHPHPVRDQPDENGHRQRRAGEHAGGRARARQQHRRRRGDGLGRLPVLQVLREAIDE